MIRRSLVQLGSLSWITFLESLRHRALVGLVLVALAFISFSLVLSELAIRDQALRVVTDFGLFSLGLLGVVIAIILGVIHVYKEVQRKTIYTVLSKPVPRPLFIVGKYLGLSGVLLATLSVMGGAWFLVLIARGGSVGMNHVVAVVLIAAEVLVITSLAVLFSTFASPVLSGVFTFGIFLVGRNINVIEHMLQRRSGLFAEHPALRPIGEAVAASFPDLTTFQVSDYLLHDIPIQPAYVGQCLAYAATYIGIFLVVAILAFQSRDFV